MSVRFVKTQYILDDCKVEDALPFTKHLGLDKIKCNPYTQGVDKLYKNQFGNALKKAMFSKIALQSNSSVVDDVKDNF